MQLEKDTQTVDHWWPSPFGADDQRGMLNHITDAKRLAALQSVQHGRVYDLGHILDEHVPVFPGRAFHQTLVTSAHHANRGGYGQCSGFWPGYCRGRMAFWYNKERCFAKI